MQVLCIKERRRLYALIILLSEATDKNQACQSSHFSLSLLSLLLRFVVVKKPTTSSTTASMSTKSWRANVWWRITSTACWTKDRALKTGVTWKKSCPKPSPLTVKSAPKSRALEAPKWCISCECLSSRSWVHRLNSIHRIENRPEDWTRLEAIYDESGKYRMDYVQAKASGDHEHDDIAGNWTSATFTSKPDHKSYDAR